MTLNENRKLRSLYAARTDSRKLYPQNSLSLMVQIR